MCSASRSDVVDLTTIQQGAAQIVVWRRAVDARVREFAADVLCSQEDLERRAEADLHGMQRATSRRLVSWRP